MQRQEVIRAYASRPLEHLDGPAVVTASIEREPQHAQRGVLRSAGDERLDQLDLVAVTPGDAEKPGDVLDTPDVVRVRLDEQAAKPLKAS